MGGGVKKKKWGKLCPRGKAAAKGGNSKSTPAHTQNVCSAVCSGKITPGEKKPKKKADGGMISRKKKFHYQSRWIEKGCGGIMENSKNQTL